MVSTAYRGKSHIMVWYDSLSSLTDEKKEVSPLVQAALKQFCEQEADEQEEASSPGLK